MEVWFTELIGDFTRNLEWKLVLTIQRANNACSDLSNTLSIQCLVDIITGMTVKRVWIEGGGSQKSVVS